jgi:hypothetical protein
MSVIATPRRVLLPLLLVFAFLLSFTASASAQPGPNHYKVYRPTPNPGVSRIVVLRDQFSPDTVEVKALSFFANPAEKRLSDGTSYPISDPRLHYAWWDLSPIIVNRTVTVDNQFGGQTLTLTTLRELWNPALKNESGLPPLANHYKCYDCVGHSVGVRGVTLNDQFGTFSADVGSPFFFCNPAEKIIPGGETHAIVDPNLHYVCYDLTPIDTRVFSAIVTDQFVHDLRVDLTSGRYLCVPTIKVNPTPARRDSWGRLKVLYR